MPNEKHTHRDKNSGKAVNELRGKTNAKPAFKSIQFYSTHLIINIWLWDIAAHLSLKLL